MSISIKDKVALVTGANRGIGKAIVESFLNHGAKKVYLAVRNPESTKALEALYGDRVVTIQADVSDSDSIKRLADQASDVEIVVNNAGILDATGINDMTMERYLEVIAVNQHGAIRVTKTLLPLIRKGDQAKRIVNIASIMGVRGSRESIPYSTAKGAIVNFTRALACDLAPEGITVNAIGPGFIDTDMAFLADGSGHEHDTEWFKEIYIKHGRIPLGRAGKPEDISGPVLFFCSDDSKYVTGQILLVDGGVSATF